VSYFTKCKILPTQIIKAIYFHHELIRIHPFADGNGRVTRIAKNWMLMYDLYPPIFVNDAPQKTEYITTLSKSFRALDQSPKKWNEYTASFFELELDRLFVNANLLYETVNRIGLERAKKNKNNVE
jgi:Fic family protein